jgi:hypothetical protein
MGLKRFTNLWVALCVGAALVLAPLATPSVAGPQAAGATQAMDGGMHTMSNDTQATAGDRPCCPDQGQANDCAGCPLMALCLVSASIALPAAAVALVTREPLRQAFSARDDAWVPGLGGHPPDHPPRSHV